MYPRCPGELLSLLALAYLELVRTLCEETRNSHHPLLVHNLPRVPPSRFDTINHVGPYVRLDNLMHPLVYVAPAHATPAG